MKLIHPVPGPGWHLAFHGSVAAFQAFTDEGSVGQGGDANSALGIHLAVGATAAQHYAEQVQAFHALRGTHREMHVYVVAYREAPAYEATHEEFFCVDLAEFPSGHPLHVTEQELAEDEFLHPASRFRTWLIDRGYRTVIRDDVEGLGGHIIVLDPANTCVLAQVSGSADIDRLVHAAQALAHEGDASQTLPRLAELWPVAVPG